MTKVGLKPDLIYLTKSTGLLWGHPDIRLYSDIRPYLFLNFLLIFFLFPSHIQACDHLESLIACMNHLVFMRSQNSICSN